MTVYFENSNGTRRPLATIESEPEVYKIIHDFIAERNIAKVRAGYKPFVSYYTRSWKNEQGETVYDVGSHSEFFILKEEE